DSDAPGSVSEPGARRLTSQLTDAPIDPALGLGSGIFLLGMDRRSLRSGQSPACRSFPAVDGMRAGSRRRYLDQVSAADDVPHVVGQFHWRRFPNGGVEGRLVFVSA